MYAKLTILPCTNFDYFKKITKSYAKYIPLYLKGHFQDNFFLNNKCISKIRQINNKSKKNKTKKFSIRSKRKSHKPLTNTN